MKGDCALKWFRKKGLYLHVFLMSKKLLKVTNMSRNEEVWERFHFYLNKISTNTIKLKF